MKVIKLLALVVVLSVLGAGYAYANVVRLVLIDYSDFEPIGDKVYLSESLPDEAEQKIIALLKTAKDRISTKYGKPLANPVIVVLGSKSEQKSYGLNGPPGTLLYAPWENYLLLSYDTANVDITAHELVHAEIATRVGYIKRQFDIPTWFDEGAAMQVDHRSEYLSNIGIDRSEFRRLTALDSAGMFWTSDRNQNMTNYRSSKSVVSEIFKQTGSSLYTVLDKVKRGDDDAVTALMNETEKAIEQERL